MLDPQRDKRDSAHYRRLRRLVLRGRPPCSLCGREMNYDPAAHREPDAAQCDHIIPLVHGGQHTLDNMQPVCRACNRAKSDRLPDGAAAITSTSMLKTRIQTAATDCPPGPCTQCNGTHNPPGRAGVTFVTARRWSPSGDTGTIATR